jgi:hypothetical protein
LLKCNEVDRVFEEEVYGELYQIEHGSQADDVRTRQCKCGVGVG